MNVKTSWLASKTNLKESQIVKVLELFDEGATIPFIARYRKDRTKGLDENQITLIQDQNKNYLESILETCQILLQVQQV